MKNIYSNHIKGQKLTSQKPSIDGVVIHNDYGSMTPSQYLNWLYRREQTGEYDKRRIESQAVRKDGAAHWGRAVWTPGTAGGRPVHGAARANGRPCGSLCGGQPFLRGRCRHGETGRAGTQTGARGGG